MQAMKTAHLGRKPMLRPPLKKHCPPLMRGNSQCGGQTTNHLLTTANVWEFSYDRQRRFLLLSTALPFLRFWQNAAQDPRRRPGVLCVVQGQMKDSSE